MLSYFQNESIYIPKPEYEGHEVNVAIDSSKTNSAIIVFDSRGQVLHDYEFRGEASDDILTQVKDQRRVLSRIFKDATIKIGGIEDIITKKSQGMNEHQSRGKITLVFASFIFYFQDNHDIDLELINNWAWKSETLPKEYRTDDHKKGSLDWHKDNKTKYAHRRDDVTDALGIKEYLCKKHGIINIERVEDTKEVSKRRCNWALYSGTANVSSTRKFAHNPSVSILDSITYITNRLQFGEVASLSVPISEFHINDLYTRCYGEFQRNENSVYLIIKRED